MIEIKQGKRKLKDGEIRNVPCIVTIDSKVTIECKNEILFYIELKDFIIILVNWYHASNLFDIFRNIFCYSKTDGSLLWQVEQTHTIKGEPLEKVYVGLGIRIKQEDGSYKPAGDLSPGENTRPFWIKYIDKPFRAGIDKFLARTFDGFQFYIDITNGKTDCYGYTK